MKWKMNQPSMMIVIKNLASPEIVRSKLDVLREKLIDLSMRNKNLNFNLVSRGRQQIESLMKFQIYC